MEAQLSVGEAIRPQRVLAVVDWDLDPGRPCAERQLRELRRLLGRVGVEVESGWVGDPETVPAVTEALDRWSAEQVMLVRGGRERAWRRPLSLRRRVGRSTRLPVSWHRVRRRGQGRVRCDADRGPRR